MVAHISFVLDTLLSSYNVPLSWILCCLLIMFAVYIGGFDNFDCLIFFWTYALLVYLVCNNYSLIIHIQTFQADAICTGDELTQNASDIVVSRNINANSGTDRR